MEPEPDMLKAIEEGASSHRIVHFRIVIVPVDDCAGRRKSLNQHYQDIACALFGIMDQKLGAGEVVASIEPLD